MKKLYSLAMVLFLATGWKAYSKPANIHINGYIRLPEDTTGANSNDSSDDGNERTYEFSLDYGTDQANRGLHDIKLPYVMPGFTYTALSGFYITLSDQYLLVPGQKGFDAFAFNPGWYIYFGDNTTLNFNYQHYIFPANSPSIIRSSLSNALETYLELWIGQTTLKLTADYDIFKKEFNQQGDFIITPDLSHTFKWKFGKSSSFSLIPEGSMDFGTKNFYALYRRKKSGQESANARGMGKGNMKNQVKDTAINIGFGALDYTLIFSVEYKIGKLAIEPAFNYSEPLYKNSALPVSSISYFTLSLSYTLSSKK